MTQRISNFLYLQEYNKEYDELDELDKVDEEEEIAETVGVNEEDKEELEYDEEE